MDRHAIIPLKTGVPDGYDEPSSPAHDRGHMIDPQGSVALDPAILYLMRGREVQPPFHHCRHRIELGMEDIRAYQLPIWSTGSTRGHTSIRWRAQLQRSLLRHHYFANKEAFEAHRRRQGAGEASRRSLNHEEIVQLPLEAVAGLRNRVALTTRPMRRDCASGRSCAFEDRLRSTANGCCCTSEEEARVAGIVTRCCRRGS